MDGSDDLLPAAEFLSGNVREKYAAAKTLLGEATDEQVRRDLAESADALAEVILALAREHEVPIVENVPLARALYAAVDVDETIPPEHFQAAAKVIGFVFQSRKRR